MDYRVLPCASIFLAFYYAKVPDGYTEIGTALNSAAQAQRLVIWTRIVAIVELAITAVLAYWNSSINHAVISVGWLALWYFSAGIHNPQSIAMGSHFSLFIVLLMQSLALGLLHANEILLMKELSVDIVSFMVSISSSTVYLLFILFWSNRSDEDDAENISLEQGASLFSSLTFSWLTPLIESGNKKPLEQSDLWRLIRADTSEQVFKNFSEKWNNSNSLAWELIRHFSPFFAYQLTCAFLSSVLSFSGPFFLYYIVNTVKERGDDYITASIVLLSSLFISSSIRSIVDGQMYFTGRRVSNRIRAVLINLLYQKALKRASVTKAAELEDGQASLGKIVTLMSVDSEDIRLFAAYCHEWLVIQPISVILALLGLYKVIGISAFAGVAIMMVLIPLGSLLGKIIKKYQSTLMDMTDKRVNIMNETLQGIRIIKYFGWEEYFISKINQARLKELYHAFWLSVAKLGFLNISQVSAYIVLSVIFGFYTVVLGNKLDAATAFTAINLLNVVNRILGFLPLVVVRFVKCIVALKRINDYLCEVELEKFYPPCDVPEEDEKHQEQTIGLKHGTFAYYAETPQDSAFKLVDIDVQFPRNRLTLVVGPTGAGKTSLLLSLLGELKRMSGDVITPDPSSSKNMNNTIAYVAQTAWLLNATIRDNILFGEEYDKERYQQVLKDCALLKDLQILKGGDLTEIGEKGINLSGGQKQRISLARACYSRSEYVLLDDPLSAVDAPTARYLLDNAILGALKGRTCILVSHYVNLVLPYADYALVLSHGALVCHGKPSELVNDPQSQSLYGTSLFVEDKEIEIKNEEIVSDVTVEGTKLIETEEKAVGSVRLAAYTSYFFAAGGILFCIAFVFMKVLISALSLFSDFWLKLWTDKSDEMLYSKSFGSPASLYLMWTDNRFEADNVVWYLEIYLAIGLFSLLISNTDNIISIWGSYFSSKNLHAQLLHSIMYSPLRFFDVTPLGRILNRFSKDIKSIDSEVIDSIAIFVSMVISGLCILITIGIVAPTFLLIVPLVLLVFFRIAKKYLVASRDLKRLESISRSPIYAQFSETLVGVATIRAYGASDRFIQQNESKIDSNHRSHFFLWVANRWLCFRIDLIANFAVFFAGVTALMNGSNAGWMALTLNYAFDLTSRLLWSVRFHAEMEMSMNSMERVKEYCELEQEPPAIIESNRPPEDWPSKGEISVANLSVKYAHDQANVLENLSFAIKAGNKVAIVGRTGAGKSTLSLAFFRILPFASGKIIIDDIDISQIGLNDLRSRITIIPQEATLFTGTIRSNLDPFDQYQDLELWNALDRVHLADTFQSKSSDATLSLDYPVTENGANFSQGQRQLLCLARALLRRTRVIFLDEATASVDKNTDTRIQNTIRQDFKDSTVITIAHRLRTIIDYDQVLVLDHGKFIEGGTPKELIASNGLFCSMCRESGEFEDLKRLAQ